MKKQISFHTPRLSLKFLTLMLGAALALTGFSGSDGGASGGAGSSSDAAASDSAASPSETSSGSSSDSDGSKTVYEIGETVKLDAITNLVDTTYEITVNSTEYGQEYDGEPLSEFVVNAVENSGLLAVNMTLKNTGGEPYSMDMSFYPNLGNDLSMAGDDPIDWFADKGLSKVVEPGSEEEVVLVFYAGPAYANEDGEFFLQFEIPAKHESYIRIPASAFH